jgi:hypothetical protein
MKATLNAFHCSFRETSNIAISLARATSNLLASNFLPSRHVFIGNLPSSFTHGDVATMVTPHLETNSIKRIILRQKTLNGVKHSFVWTSSVENARSCIHSLTSLNESEALFKPHRRLLIGFAEEEMKSSIKSCVGFDGDDDCSRTQATDEVSSVSSGSDNLDDFQEAAFCTVSPIFVAAPAFVPLPSLEPLGLCPPPQALSLTKFCFPPSQLDGRDQLPSEQQYQYEQNQAYEQRQMHGHQRIMYEQMVFEQTMHEQRVLYEKQVMFEQQRVYEQQMYEQQMAYQMYQMYQMHQVYEPHQHEQKQRTLDQQQKHKYQHEEVNCQQEEIFHGNQDDLSIAEVDATAALKNALGLR